MWHEARRQEKLIRSQMIDSVKRNERRKIFYENVRKDPEQFMQLHGRKSQIHVDPAVARAAEASNILWVLLFVLLCLVVFVDSRKWQGDPQVLIDRFDARAHLDFIAEVNRKDDEHRPTIDVEELQCEYERYRILILNEFDRGLLRKFTEVMALFLRLLTSRAYCKDILELSERTFLKEIAAKEFWPDESTSSSTNRIEHEKKKQSRDKKAAVAFQYEDTAVVKGHSTQNAESESSDEEDEIIEPEEFVPVLSGRQAKAERALLKKKRSLIVGKGCLNEEATTTLLSFVTQNKSQYEETSSSSSSSEGEEKTEFITSFGEEPGDKADKRSDDDDLLEEDEERNVVHGPALPSAEFRRIFELKTRRSSSPEDLSGVTPSASSYARRRVRSRSPMRRMRSRSRDKFSKRDRREIAKSRSRSRERARSRTKSRSRERRQRSRSKDRKGERSRSPIKVRNRSRSRSRSHGKGRSKRDRDRKSTSKERRSRRKSRSKRFVSSEKFIARLLLVIQIDVLKRTENAERIWIHFANFIWKRSESRERKSGERRYRLSDSGGTGRLSSTESPNQNNRSNLMSPQQSKSTGSVLSPSRSNGDTSPLAIRSSMSESERERIEVENRRRRIRRTARMHRQHNVSSTHGDRSSDDETERKTALAHRLKLQMQRALRKTAEELKEEERHKLAEQLEQRRRREERVYEESLELRRR
ncbi:unnamed protein product [Anisakis simplex]|uniref:CLK4-associating serine/arginine rich protein (inferred by orthology to a human protein) n=1 Tax=Anisakis simplex TaxID=6269 RepID=A0A0M3K3K6_ANISI|nr:unnamed protein product [Anisakis simplex]